MKKESEKKVETNNKKHLHPGARWLFRFRAYGVLLIIFLFLGWIPFLFAGFIIKILTGNDSAATFSAVLFMFFTYFLIADIYARMSYNRWLYEFTNNGLRIEKGIIWKKYATIPYKKIQNVDLSRGIIARMLGFTTMDIETAGHSWGGHRRRKSKSEGHIPGVEKGEAEKIRTHIMNKTGSGNEV